MSGSAPGRAVGGAAEGDGGGGGGGDAGEAVSDVVRGGAQGVGEPRLRGELVLAVEEALLLTVADQRFLRELPDRADRQQPETPMQQKCPVDCCFLLEGVAEHLDEPDAHGHVQGEAAPLVVEARHRPELVLARIRPNGQMHLVGELQLKQ